VLDIPGGYGKVPVGPQYVDMCGDAGAAVEDINGMKRSYP
jgi:lysine 2,3-aminomutase